MTTVRWDSERVDDPIIPLIECMIKFNIHDGNYYYVLISHVNFIYDDNHNEDYNANLECNQYEFDASD
eukprot:Pgem_evm1s5320